MTMPHAWLCAVTPRTCNRGVDRHGSPLNVLATAVKFGSFWVRSCGYARGKILAWKHYLVGC